MASLFMKYATILNLFEYKHTHIIPMLMTIAGLAKPTLHYIWSAYRKTEVTKSRNI